MEKRFPDHPRLVARPVHTATQPGMGLYAEAGFASGESVLVLNWDDEETMTLVPWEETETEHQDRCTAIAPRWYVYCTAEHPFWFLNHSCCPNVAYQDWARSTDGKSIALVALREIQPGEQITIDYSTMTASDDGLAENERWTMQCLCGEKSCRHLLTDFVSLPRERQMELVLQSAPVSGLVPAFIVNESPELVMELQRHAPEMFAAFQLALQSQQQLARKFAEEYVTEDE